jgi:hypothetical protein
VNSDRYVEILVLPALVAARAVADLDPVQVVGAHFADGERNQDEPGRVGVRRDDE